jgi:hypothetical protein
VAYCCWPVIHCGCMLWIHWFMGIYCHSLNGNHPVQLEVAYSIDESMCKQTFNTLAWIQLNQKEYQTYMKHMAYAIKHEQILVGFHKPFTIFFIIFRWFHTLRKTN